MLKVENISKCFNKTHAVDNVSFEVKEGEILSLTGESGCGKSTLLRIIAGLEKADKGSIFLEGQDISNTKPEKRGFGFVFQNLSLFPHLSVEKNILFAIPKKKRTKSQLYELLEKTGMVGLENRYPHELSGGQQQRVALARSLAIEPKILILDEPFSSLDELLKAKIRDEIFHLLKELKITTIMVSHQASDSFLIADQLVIMRNGRILQKNTPPEIYQNPISEYVFFFFGASVIIHGKKDSGKAITSFGNLNIKDLPEEEFNLCIRPENIMIASERNASLSGRVHGKLFKGSHDVLTIQSLTSEERFDLETERSYHEVGDHIYLQVSEGKILIFD